MSNVWLTIPSARPPAEAEPILRKWMKQGYKVALWCDKTGNITPPWAIVHGCADYVMGWEYQGYARAVNELIAAVMLKDPEAEWFIAAGDDTEPDLDHTAEEIAEQCGRHFSVLEGYGKRTFGTFGVMQPTGDRFAEGSIDRIAGSAWLGREFCRRINQGKGPLWPEYVHNFVDEELQNVAIKYGIFWQRPDLIQLHRHFQRESDRINSPAVSRPIPAHLKTAFSPEGWGPYKAIFEKRKATGFPGSEPIA